MTIVTDDAIKLLAELKHLGLTLREDGGELRCSGAQHLLHPQRLAAIRQHKRELIALLGGQTALPARPPKLPLSFAQQRLWFMAQMIEGQALFHLPLLFDIEGLLDFGLLKHALATVVARHEILRTRYITENGEPTQQILPVGAAAACAEIDASAFDEARIRQTLLDAIQRPFDLSSDLPIRALLLRHSEQSAILCLTLHHIACDGWSLDILAAEFAACYRAALLGLDANLPDLSAQYAEFALWQRQRLDAVRLAEQTEFWRAQLAAPLPALEFPKLASTRASTEHRGAFVEFKIPADLVERLRNLGQSLSASLFMTLLSGYYLMLHKYSGQTDIVVGVPIANRQLRAFENLIGLFVNTLVLRNRLQTSAGFDKLLSDVRQTVLNAFVHQDFPFEKLLEIVPVERDLQRNPIFQAKFRLETLAPGDAGIPGLKLTRLPQPVVKAKLDLSMDLYETGDGIVGALEFDTALFDAETVNNMARHYLNLLEAAADYPQRPLAALDMLTPTERRLRLATWNDTARPFQRDTCFHYLFEAAAAKFPEQPALLFDRDGDLETVEYAELNRSANRLAHRLRAFGIGPERIVAICLERSPEMIVALLAVLKVGGAYLPLAADYPRERLAFMLADADAAMVITQSQVALPETAAIRLDLDRNEEISDNADAERNPPRVNIPEHLAYVIYTSGSTGRPKGVMIEHRGLVNLTEDKIRVCDIRPGDCVLQFFSFSFDASIPEIVMSLAAGAALLLAPATAMLPGPGLSDLLVRRRVTHITMTPSALSALPEGDYPDLRMALVGGEAPKRELIERWSPNRVFINAYGPTETTVNASMVRCGNGYPTEATIQPSANKQLYVLDEQLNLLPCGVAGELHIGGVGLARGYLNRPELTAEQFVPNPFRDCAGPDASERLYRTGDLACQLPDGRIRILGRIDHQVKIRGFRVELGEIEHALAGHPAVRACAVITVAGDDALPRLAAFVVGTAGNEAQTAEILAYLTERLPHYMVPGNLHWLNALPLTPNDKVDTRALAALASAQTREQVLHAPRNATEQTLAKLFGEILNCQSIGSETDFFEAGGHSLLATKLVARLLELFDVELTVVDLFQASTVENLAQRIELKQKLARLTDSPASMGEREEIEL